VVAEGWLSELETVVAVVRGDDLAPGDPELRRAYLAAVAGLIPADLGRAAEVGLVPVPAYRVTTDADGAFVVVAGPAMLTEVQRAVMMGDVRRRLEAGIAAGTGGDPFADVRHDQFVGSWPADAGQQRRTFPCQVCGGISTHPEDVADRYCVRCHRFTGDRVDATPGSPLARAGDAGDEVAGLPGLDSSGVVSGVRPHLPNPGEEAEARRRFAEDDLRRHPLQVPDWLAEYGQPQQPVMPDESS